MAQAQKTLARYDYCFIYDFLLSISAQNITELGATLNGHTATVVSLGKLSFAGLESSGQSPFILNITGFAAKSATYSGELAVTAAVPEPESYAMMLAGLGVMGFVARRKNKN